MSGNLYLQQTLKNPHHFALGSQLVSCPLKNNKLGSQRGAGAPSTPGAPRPSSPSPRENLGEKALSRVQHTEPFTDGLPWAGSAFPSREVFITRFHVLFTGRHSLPLAPGLGFAALSFPLTAGGWLPAQPQGVALELDRRPSSLQPPSLLCWGRHLPPRG